MTTQPKENRSRARTTVVVALAVTLLLLAAAIYYWNKPSVQPASESVAKVAPGPVYTIVLPRNEPVLPPGPNRDQFQASCTQCHSPRLVLNQPKLPEKKWKDIVHKMVVAYGAQLPPEKELEVVTYLNRIRGLDSDAKPAHKK